MADILIYSRGHNKPILMRDHAHASPCYVTIKRTLRNCKCERYTQIIRYFPHGFVTGLVLNDQLGQFNQLISY
jgi:hypothetical protein